MERFPNGEDPYPYPRDSNAALLVKYVTNDYLFM